MRALLAAACAWTSLLVVSPPAQAQDAPLAGTWKLLVLPYGDDEFAILDLSEENGALNASVVDAQAMLPQAAVSSVTREGATLTITLKSQSSELVFKGQITEDPKAKPILGSANFRGSFFPARLESTDARKVGALGSGKLVSRLMEARGVADAKERLAKLQAIIDEAPESPSNHLVFMELMKRAVEAESPEADIKKQLERWVGSAKPYGPEWSNEVQTAAARALMGKKPYAAMVLELARGLEGSMTEATTTEKKAEVLGMLAEAAGLAGDQALAESTGQRLLKLEEELDAEYEKKVPPFQFDRFGRKAGTEQASVVVMELFTGAQCPPCVAADVAFDALLKTYQPTEFIGLQYHLHIPGPDPLTNQDTITRAGYYGVRSTPSTLFNGQPALGGGGSMAGSEGKYKAYRDHIEPLLESPPLAEINLEAKRDGQTIQIKVSATASEAAMQPKKPEEQPKEEEEKEEAKTAKDDEPKGEEEPKKEASKDEPKLPEPRLRLAVVEEVVRYVGGNRLRFHHHVVRALPGGAEGVPFAEGKASREMTVQLDEVRAGIESYLSDFAKESSFAGKLPALGMEKLSVVAFVQDDSDKSIWHGVLVPLEAPK